MIGLRINLRTIGSESIDQFKPVGPKLLIRLQGVFRTERLKKMLFKLTPSSPFPIQSAHPIFGPGGGTSLSSVQNPAAWRQMNNQKE